MATLMVSLQHIPPLTKKSIVSVKQGRSVDRKVGAPTLGAIIYQICKDHSLTRVDLLKNINQNLKRFYFKIY